MPRFGIVLVGALLLFGGTALMLVGGRAYLPAVSSPAAVSASPLPTSASGAVRPIPDGYRLQIPRLGIDLPVTEGQLQRDTVDLATPESWAFHLPGTAIPGAGGNTYLYAHARRGMFLTLWNARVGDEVFVTTPDYKLLRYVVSEVHPKVAPDDTSWVQPTPGERLTLQTSTGPSPGDPRFVVIAQPA